MLCGARVAGKSMPVRMLGARATQSLDVECNGQMQRLRVIEAERELHLSARAGTWCCARRGPRMRCRSPPGRRKARCSRRCREPWSRCMCRRAASRRGAPLVTVEAMKMEHTLTAPYDGVVARIAFGVGERVAAGAILVELAPLEDQAWTCAQATWAASAAASAGSVTLKRVSCPRRLASAILPPASCT